MFSWFTCRIGRSESGGTDGSVEPTGRTTHVTVSMADMRYSQSTIEVPAGNRLVVILRNDDEQMVHDLVLDNGESSGRTKLAIDSSPRGSGWRTSTSSGL